MEIYQAVRLIHIVSGAVLFGTGAGIAFFMLRAHLSGNREAMAITTSNVVLADWIFTTPAVVIQAVTGIWMTVKLSIPMNSIWFISVITLFILVGLCWIPVVRIQIKIREIINSDGDQAEYQKLMRIWIALGIPAFLGVLAIYFLMVTKPGLGIKLFA